MNNDLISRSALLELAHNHVGGTVDCNDIARFPAVDAEVVRHGRWVLAIADDDELMLVNVTGYWCNQCWKPGEKHFNYCPNCGAKMDAEVHDDARNSV